MPPLLSRIFAMDCARFDGDVVEEKYTMELNTAEEWTLRNFAGGAHPFHIHVNPFQVVEIFDPSQGDNGTTTTFGPDEALWQDVVAIPLPKNGTPGHVRIRQRFLTYPGDFVIHCHFLNHEDLGMMKRVRVVPGPDAPGHPPCVPVRVCSRS
jgi:FtsP/CotA-like multicopper oxidase with cupredoxin domain